MSNKKQNNEPMSKSALRRKERDEKRLTTIQQRKQQRIDYLNSTEHKLNEMARQQKAVKKWYKLDNAALMYPMTAYGESDHVFRMSALLKSPVDPLALQRAINKIFVRFPTMTGTVRSGIFWPYIDKPYIPIVATFDDKLPCRPMPQDGKHSQTRVLYRGNQIACEFYHSATDGTGGLLFLNSLLLAYFGELGIEIDDTTNALDCRDLPNVQETIDHFTTIAIKKNPPKRPPIIKSSPIGGTPLPNKTYRCIRGICSASQLKAVAKQYNATITEFLGAVQLLAIAESNRQTNTTSNRPIKTLVPVNLRKLYNLNTLRNFTSYIFYSYTGQTTVQEMVDAIKQQVKEMMTKQYFDGMVSYNYNSGNHPLLRIVPIALKKIVMRIVINMQGEGVVNGSTLSNVGIVPAPPAFANYIHRYDFMLGRGDNKILNLAVATFQDVCTMSFSNSKYETIAERYFFSTLASLGVDLAIESDTLEGLE